MQKENALENRPEYVLFSLIFIVLGLTFLSAAMNLLVLRFLTMNTADEKRDQKEAKLAAKGLATINSLEGKRKYASMESSSSSTSSGSDEGGGRGRRGKRISTVTKGNDPAAETGSLDSCSCYQLAKPKISGGCAPEMRKCSGRIHNPHSRGGGKRRRSSLVQVFGARLAPPDPLWGWSQRPSLSTPQQTESLSPTALVEEGYQLSNCTGASDLNRISSKVP